jgi:hypothetical protein
MFCDEGLPFSLCSSILLLIAITLESVPLAVGFILITFLNNIQFQSYTIPLEKDQKEEIKEKSKHSIAIQQKYKCANFIDKSEIYNCLLKDGVFDEAGYKTLDNKVYCPMCYSAIKNKKI